MTAKRLDLKKQIYSVQQTVGERKAPDMTVSLYRGGQHQVFFLPEYLASFQFPTMAKSAAWQF